MRGLSTRIQAVAGLGAVWTLTPIPVTVLITLCLASLVRTLPGLPWTALVAGGLTLSGASLFAGTTPVQALVLALGVLQVRRCLGHRGTADDQASLVIGLLMLVIGVSEQITPFMLGCVIVWICAVARVLSASTSPRAPRWLVGAVLLGTLALYPFLPRFGPTYVRPVGFSEQVTLGEAGPLLADTSEVFRVEIEGPATTGPIYFRGMALDQFDGTTWQSTAPRVADPDATVGLLGGVIPEGRVRLQITQQPTREGILFTAGRVDRIGATTSVQRDAFGARYVVADTAVKVALLTRPPLGPGQARPVVLSPEARERFLALPDLDPRVPALASEVAIGDGEAATIESLVAWLRANTRYTALGAGVSAEEALSRFLFSSRTGHCVYHASALAVLARAAGIPARVITGYAGGDVQDDGSIVIRKRHAHAWVEVYLPGQGWVVYDSTPGPATTVGYSEPMLSERLSRWVSTSFRRTLIDYDARAQWGGALTAGGAVTDTLGLSSDRIVGIWLLGVASILGLIGLWAALRRLLGGLSGEHPPPPRSSTEAAYRRVRRHLKRQGWAIPPQLPPVAAAEWMGPYVDYVAATALTDLAWCLYRERYGEEPAVPETVAALVARIEEIGPPAL